MKRLVFVCCALGFPLCAPAADFFMLTSGTSTFTLSKITGAPTLPGLCSFVVGGKDQMFQNWWWFNLNDNYGRIAEGDTGWNRRLGNQKKLQRLAANEYKATYLSTSEFRDGTYSTLTFVFDYKLTELVANKRARLDVDFSISNNGFHRVVINFFNYNDADIDGSAQGDEADITRSSTRQRVWEDDNVGVRLGELRYTALGPDWPRRSWQIAANPGLRNLLESKVRTTSLSNGGAPFGPGDYGGAFHWGGTLELYGTLTGYMSLDVKVP